MYFFFELLQYKLKSKSRHGVHSPFVYDFTDVCLKLNISITFKVQTKISHKKFAKNIKKITINDQGAGSKHLGNERKLKDIYKNASIKGIYQTLLCQLMAHYSPKTCLEFGTSLGIGTHCMTYLDDQRKVTTVDACFNTQKIAIENFKSLGIYPQINAVNSTFQEYLDALSPNETFDFIYIDGHHSGKALLNYIEQLKSHATPNTIFLLDDIRWSKDMLAAWNQIKKDEDFHLTMDLFRMGIVILRPQQRKEHFVIHLKNILSGF